MILIGSGASAAGTLLPLGAIGVQQWWVLVTAEFIVGAGTAICSTALNKTASISLEAGSAGLASGIYNTSRQVGQAVGIAVLGALAALADPRVGYVPAVVLITGCTVAIAGTALRAADGGSSPRAFRAAPHPLPQTTSLAERGSSPAAPRGREPR